MGFMDRISGKGAAEVDGRVIPAVERCLTLLVEGAALNVPEIEAESYKNFRTNVTRLSMKIPDRLADNEKLELIRSILFEFETYRNSSETALRERLSGWRGTAKTLFKELLSSLGTDPKSPNAAALMKAIGDLVTAEEMSEWDKDLAAFLHPPDAEGKAQGLAAVKTADTSTENDNAAGLRGGGAAVEYVQKIMDRNGTGFVALFRLSCLGLITQRFGAEAVEDCLMAVSSFLISNLHSDDTIFHWGESSLLAVLQGRANEQILNAELYRIVSQNRESSVNVQGRTIMLRIPLTYELTPINRLHSAEDLYRLSTRNS